MNAAPPSRTAPDIVITGTGLAHPPHSVSNAELVASLAESVRIWNDAHAAEIEAGTLVARATPDEEFIVKASGIHSRYVMEKEGVLDPMRMRPILPLRGEDELGIQAEMAVPAVMEALQQAGRTPADVDAIIVGAPTSSGPIPPCRSNCSTRWVRAAGPTT
jgi:beta-ketodecanoyl-[acyl-carrier-protein] synthase